MKSSVILFISLFLLCCSEKQTDPGESAHLGELHHKFLISDIARAPFEKGLLLLHSFEYDDAHEAFGEAIAADSNNLMSYWGDVMTRYKALWGLQDVEAGRKIMAQVDSSPERRLTHAKDDMERDLWQGVEILFGEGEFKERNQKYADHMGVLYDKYPGNQEVAAFYSISLLWAGNMGADKEKARLSAQIADGILQENPNHPGALHYKIHAYDNPEFAPEAKQVADLYSKIAPDATHALHMPSHIYLALGLWDDVVSSNEASYAASIARIKRKNLGDDARGYHSYAWLHYGYLQQGRYEDAADLLRDMYRYLDKAPTQTARSYLITMQNAQLAEAPLWENSLIPRLEIQTDDLGIVSAAAHSFFVAHRAFKEGDIESIETQIRGLKTKIATASLQVSDDGVAMCSAGTTRYAPNENSLRVARSLQLQMEAFVAALTDDKDKFEEKIIEATQLELDTKYAGPPDIALPSFEQYAYWLLENNRLNEALDQFNKSLTRAPKRVNALRGKMYVLEKMNRHEEASEISAELKGIWSKADDVALKYIAGI